MLGLGATVSSLNFNLGHRIDFYGYFYHRCTFILLRSGRREGLDPDLASSLELKSVVSSPNKREKNLKFWYHKEAKIGPESREREYYYYHTKF